MSRDDNSKSDHDGTPRGDASAGTQSRQQPISNIGDLPRPSVQHSRLPRYLVWIIPLLAVVAALYYANVLAKDHGPTVTITIEDAGQVEPGKTVVRCRGVEIGKVIAVQLADDRKRAHATLRLHRDADDFARDGAKFWLVQADFSGGSLDSLTTVLKGAFVGATPGTGEAKRDFDSLPHQPVARDDGLHIQLFANKLNDITSGTAVNYRGLKVGAITGATLADDATRVVIRATIESRYAPLIRANSAFWFQPAADVRGDLFSGVEFKVGTLRSLFSGGISVATPDQPFAEPAADDTSFALLSEMPKDAEGWRPQIAITPGADDATRAAANKEAEANKRARGNALE